MKSQRSVVFIAIFVAMFFAVGSAFAANLKVMQTDETNPSTTGVANVSITLENLSASEASWITASGAAFTIEYGSGLIYVPGSLQSKFFDTFQAQFEAAGSDPMPATSTENYDQPLVENNDDTKMTMVAAARCVPGDYKGMVLFTMQVQLMNTDPSNAGTYSITVKPTKLYNEAAGYTDTSGTPIPVVVGSDESKDYSETGAYPVIIDEQMPPVMANVVFKSNGVGAPTITNISQSGDKVTITGTGFVDGGTTVKFGETASPNVTFNSANEIEAEIPAGVSGNVNVTVSTSNGSVSKAHDILEDGEVTVKIPLHAGWNLISFGINKCFYVGTQPTVAMISGIKYENVSSIADVFSSINGEYTIIRGFDTGAKSFNPLNPIFSNMKYVASGYGYWIKVKDDANFDQDGLIYLSITGSRAMASSSITLHTGWNLVGYIGTKVKYVGSEPTVDFPPDSVMDPITSLNSDVFCSINDEYSIVRGFDTGAKSFNPLNPIFSNMKYVGPGYGYWIKIKDDAVDPTLIWNACE